MTNDPRELLRISPARLETLNAVMGGTEMAVIDDLLAVIARYGTADEINRKAREARQPANLRKQLAGVAPDYLDDLDWLIAQRDSGAFVSAADYHRSVRGEDTVAANGGTPVTLEVSAAQYFPWVRHAAECAIADRTLMPGRFIRVRKMKEQEADGDLPAFTAAMDIIGATVVETLDTKGTDGANIHLNGPETITGYFGGIGQPNDYALKWADEFLYYYTEYGVKQVLNINPGTVLVGYLMHRLGIDIEFKISVFMGNDNPYAALWTLLAGALFARDDGSSPLIGFNWSNSVNNETIVKTSEVRAALGWDEQVRFEHHITETWKSIVRQPYNRREELLEIAGQVANISAKHEGGDPEVDQQREHPSDILDYFRDRQEIVDSGNWDALRQNFMDKVDATNRTAAALSARGLSFVAAKHLHHRT